MTNNYFKIYHYLPIMGLRVDVRTTYFFFDDRDQVACEHTFKAATEFAKLLASLMYGRHVQLAVYRPVYGHPELLEIGSDPSDGM